MQRIKNETQEQYRKRRITTQLAIKNKLKGKLFYTGYTPFVRQKDVKRIGFTHALRNAKGYAQKLTNKTRMV